MTPEHPRTVLITGASTGFGNLTARTLLERGHHVFATMRDPRGRNAEHAAGLEAFAAEKDARLTVLELDVTDQASVDRAVAAALEETGRIDVLVNNAGQAYLGPFEASSDRQLREQFDVNFFGAANTARAVMPAMRAQGGGLIVNVSSGLGRFVLPGMGVYCASKYALEAMSEALRYEGAPFGIDSVSVEPGAFETELVGRFVNSDRTDTAAAYGPLGDASGMMRASLDEYFATGGGKPADVSDAIAGLIDQDPAVRPSRVVVGGDVGFIDELNQATHEPVRAGMEAFGMQDFAHLVR
jgi:NAD(P)-dependent dehydrogenase (short-subunit alcohol dehydrogenase family)